MTQISPMRAGFEALRREPAVVLTEISWRWTFGAAAIALSTASLMVYLSTLTVSRAELFALRSPTPWLMVDAVVHILRGSGPRLVLIAFVVTSALTIAWIAAAALGRAATLAQLGPDAAPLKFRRLVLLHIMRAVFFFASMIAYIGAAILADGAARAGSEPSIEIYTAVFLLLAIVITFAHSRVSWLSSVATIFVVRYQDTVGDALRRSAALLTRRPGQITKTNAIFGVVHFVVFVTASFMALSALALFGEVPAGVALAVIAVITLVYFAFVDFLYIARLAAYVSLIEVDGAPLVPALTPPQPVLPPAPPLESPA